MGLGVVEILVGSEQNRMWTVLNTFQAHQSAWQQYLAKSRI